MSPGVVSLYGMPEGVIAMASSSTRTLMLPAVRSRMPMRSSSIPTATISAEIVATAASDKGATPRA